MAKLTGPLLSFGSKGQIGKTLVTANWRGIPYARQYVVPANPRTTAQQANRTRFALLREMWKLSPAIVRAPWTAFATGRQFLNFNAFVGENNRLLSGQANMQSAIMSPGARGGIPPIDFVADTGGGPGEIECTFTLPTQIPDGWSISGIGAASVRDQDPTGIFSGPFVAATDAAPATTLTLVGNDAGDDCVAYGWVEYTRPDGQTAYSVSLADTATAG